MISKKWIKPELVIIVRNRPEEAVLWLCKNDDGARATEENTDRGGCRYYSNVTIKCESCHMASGT